MEGMAKEKMTKGIVELRHMFGLFGYLLVVWGCYRLIFKLPDEVEELFLKPIFWLVPTLWIVLRVEKRSLSSLGWTTKNFFPGLSWGLGLGMVFAIEGLLGNVAKYGQISFSALPYSSGGFLGALGLSIAAAISEETVFRGYILGRLGEVIKGWVWPVLLTSVLFVLIHLPVTVFVLKYDLNQTISYFFLLFLFSLGSSWIFTRLRTIFPSILIHSLWGWSILLFR